MKIIKKNNFIVILCCTYTLISLTNAILELFFHQINENESLNSLTILGVSTIAMLVLSMQSFLKKWNILLVMVFQYVVFIGSIMLLMWAMNYVIPLHPRGYHDMFLSCTFFYLIGAVAYYISFFVQIWRENQMLDKIQRKGKV